MANPKLKEKITAKDDIESIVNILGNEAEYLLNHKCRAIPKNQLHLPGPSFVDEIMVPSDRSNIVMINFY